MELRNQNQEPTAGQSAAAAADNKILADKDWLSTSLLFTNQYCVEDLKFFFL